ncbi:hypothetical protein BDZ90DRAFT_260628 [Jaminaea rosea]|uniref:Uncharacterized protein n=1 Tax=Jaminaea rosea TaxID=1569628 RepID=A0A316UQJ6_9BASI|nr:hypothetical protein BDZ90DRAFT_260628 [Jaminaea rosea]PWN27560.1 hypothetical protein BDZ90DRAFT_260628 [Jaminaea rosea]
MNTNNKRPHSPDATTSAKKVNDDVSAPTDRPHLAPINTNLPLTLTSANTTNEPSTSALPPVVADITEPAREADPAWESESSPIEVPGSPTLEAPLAYYRSTAPNALPAGIAPAPRIDASLCLPGLFRLVVSIWLRHLAACNATDEDVFDGDLPLVMLDGQIWWGYDRALYTKYGNAAIAKAALHYARHALQLDLIHLANRTDELSHSEQNDIFDKWIDGAVQLYSKDTLVEVIWGEAGPPRGFQGKALPEKRRWVVEELWKRCAEMDVPDAKLMVSMRLLSSADIQIELTLSSLSPRSSPYLYARPHLQTHLAIQFNYELDMNISLTDALNAGLGKRPKTLTFPSTVCPISENVKGEERRHYSEWKEEFQRNEPRILAAHLSYDEVDGIAAMMKAYSPYQLRWILSVLWPSVHGRPVQAYVQEAKATQLEVAEALSIVLFANHSDCFKDLKLSDIFANEGILRSIEKRQAKESADIKAKGAKLHAREVKKRTRVSVRAFFNKLAGNSAAREPPQGDRNEKTKELSEWLFADWQRSQTCPSCSQTVTTITYGEQGNEEVDAEDRYHPWNASLDRVVPEHEGGSYWVVSNREMLCWACNALKGNFSQTQARQLVQQLITVGLDRSHLVQRRIVLRNDAKLPQVAPLPFFLDEIRAWSKQQEIVLGSRCLESQKKAAQGGKGKVKKMLTSAQELTKMMLELVVAPGDKVQLHCGVVVPIDYVSIDRLNSEDDYRASNLRPTLYGINAVIKDVDDDTGFWDWMCSARSKLSS